MKTPEDEAFDELARKQGAWGGGFPAKRKMAADKLQENVPLYVSKTAFGSWREFASDYERGFIDGMQKQAQSSVDKAVNQMAQSVQEPVACERCKQLEEQAYDLLGQLKAANLKWSVAHPWVGLNDKESIDVIKKDDNYKYPIKLLQAVMDALKAKNT
jgi:hypothetical protein